jgi:tetratricopeptide (TPR) repeat protein
MSIPEWYTGSDRNGDVPEGIEAIIAKMDEHKADHQDISRLRDLQSIETEVNWRAFLLSLVGTIHYDLQELDQAAEALESALVSYKPYLSTFDEVLSVYCQTCYTAGVLFYEREQYAVAAPYLLRCLPYLHEVYENAYVGDIYSLLTICLNMGDDVEGALVFAEAAAFARQYDCESLENLMIAYVATGDTQKASEVFQVLSERCRHSDAFQRILDFARQNLGETGSVN